MTHKYTTEDIQDLKFSVSRLREVQMRIESDDEAYKRIDDIMGNIEMLIDEVEGE